MSQENVEVVRREPVTDFWDHAEALEAAGMSE
jgi:hypothetical protein